MAGFGNQILDHLSRSEIIIQEVIVPALINDCLDQNLARHRYLSLAALNRLAPVLSGKYLGLLL